MCQRAVCFRFRDANIDAKIVNLSNCLLLFLSFNTQLVSVNGCLLAVCLFLLLFNVESVCGLSVFSGVVVV